jgi:hypothetical protein
MVISNYSAQVAEAAALLLATEQVAVEAVLVEDVQV